MYQNDQNKQVQHNSRNSHIWMMSICCGLPIVGFVAIAVLGLSMPSLETVLLLVCPVGMVGMMFLMYREKSAGNNRDSAANVDDDDNRLRNKEVPDADAESHPGKF